VKVTYRIFPTACDLAKTLASVLTDRIRSAERDTSTLTLALSGGNTPKLLLSVLADEHMTSVNWRFIHIFWVDERCVPPDDPESNYGMTERLLLGKTDTPPENIHRIRGENDPRTEAARYSEEILKYTRQRNNLPVFDIIILGMGEDGHTASIFPENLELLTSESICDMAIHPVSGQKRVTLTGKVINNADEIIFLVTGKDKAGIVSEVIKKKAKNLKYPAAHIISAGGKTSWLLDEEAGKLLE
jgi:6-phosphogluconolactonase